MARVMLVAPSPPADPGAGALVEAFVAALEPWNPVLASPRTALHRLPSVTAVVVPGGTLRGDGPRRAAALRRLARLLHTAALLGRRTALVGVGAGSLPPGGVARTVRRLAERADLLVLRDDPSCQALAAVGARPPFRIGADPTWTLVDRHPVALSADRSGVAVVPHPARSVTESVVAALDAMGARPRIVPWTGSDPGGLLAARDAIATASVAVTGRLHGLVAAAAAQVPAVAVGSEPGLIGLARRLQQPWLPSGTDPGALREALAASAPVPTTAVKGEVAQAEEGFRLLRLVLSGGASEEVETLVGLPLGPPR